MKQITTFLLLLIVQLSIAQQGRYVLVIHGGAGTILKSQLTAEKEKAYRAGLNKALEAGNKVLQASGNSQAISNKQ